MRKTLFLLTGVKFFLSENLSALDSGPMIREFASFPFIPLGNQYQAGAHMTKSPIDRAELTYYLGQWQQGDAQALGQLIDQVYQDLKGAAIHYLNSERRDHTLQPTALIHEVYMRLQANGALSFENRAQFFGFAGRLMRQILVEHARAKSADKRGGEYQKVLISNIDVLGGDKDEADANSVLAVDQALQKLERLDKRQSQIIELRFFAGLSIPEVANALEISEATVQREWRVARLWFMRELAAT
jgi:RNA polymerase sigma factor (TIGR02999 family)